MCGRGAGALQTTELPATECLRGNEITDKHSTPTNGVLTAPPAGLSSHTCNNRDDPGLQLTKLNSEAQLGLAEPLTVSVLPP
ncbi:hypothetical protein MHYP_G00261050 [Metynnis hypsauchen]